MVLCAIARAMAAISRAVLSSAHLILCSVNDPILISRWNSGGIELKRTLFLTSAGSIFSSQCTKLGKSAEFVSVWASMCCCHGTAEPALVREGVLVLIRLKGDAHGVEQKPPGHPKEMFSGSVPLIRNSWVDNLRLSKHFFSPNSEYFLLHWQR